MTANGPNDLARALRAFFADHLPRVRGTSPHTVRSYRDSGRTRQRCHHRARLAVVSWWHPQGEQAPLSETGRGRPAGLSTLQRSLTPPVHPLMNARQTQALIRRARDGGPGLCEQPDATTWVWSDLHLGHKESVTAFDRPSRTPYSICTDTSTRARSRPPATST